MRRRKTVNADLIMSLGPCVLWPEVRVRMALPERVRLADFLRLDHIPAKDRLWVALHREFLDDRTLRLFACNCAERALISGRDVGCEPNECSLNAITVARRYADGEATGDDLRTAMERAGHIGWYIAEDDAAFEARYAAEEAADCSDDYDTERQWQIDHLIEMNRSES